MRAPFAILFFLLSACSGMNIGDHAGGGGTAAPAATDAGASVKTAKGVDCILESTSGATLCTGISLCPQLAVNHDAYPHCGFRVKGNTLDLECACSGSLCPIGVPTTCDQARKLLSVQSEATVCTQVSEGRCTTSTPTTPAGSGTCDRACASACGGDPTCIKQCGC